MQLECAQGKKINQIFIDSAKAYDTLDIGRTLEILEGYCVGQRIIIILTNFDARQLAVARQAGYHNSPFEVNRGVTQGEIPSPTIFNVICDAVFRAWKVEVTAGIFSSVRSRVIEEIAAKLYDDDGVLASTTAPELQDSVNNMVEIFERVNIKTNTSKKNSMTCQPRPEQGHLSDHAYKRMMDTSGESYRAHQKRCVICPLCDAGMEQGYLSRHLRQVHGLSETPLVDCPVATMEDVEQSDSYQMRFPSRTPSVPFSVSGCPGRADNLGNLRRHFMYKHPQDRITIMEEGPLPRCKRCDMFIPTKTLASGHR
jgi:hypothetical protein